MSHHENSKLFQAFVDSDIEVMKYLHNTHDEETALKILNEGFLFEDRLDYTTDLVSGKDIVQLDYFKLIRKKYGTYTIVIHIAKELINKYNHLLKNTNSFFYEVLSERLPEKSADGEYLYILDKQFIKGYYNQKTNTYFKNKHFNPTLNLDVFEKRMQDIKNRL